MIHSVFHPDGERFAFDWDWLPASGLTSKDFIAPTSFEFGTARTFHVGSKLGAVSFLQILAPELTDTMLRDFLDTENSVIVNLHVQAVT